MNTIFIPSVSASILDIGMLGPAQAFIGWFNIWDYEINSYEIAQLTPFNKGNIVNADKIGRASCRERV